ncbi:hypothetical protein DE146DRAFT_630156 [Phaeosphaeria sp. MPI-PUGE-AT-0046c]|nr:hypothetical protein DE146DRAFT_630156 [Phaeosphaeria sp. MPI-PUGE-AT-0046c]
MSPPCFAHALAMSSGCTVHVGSRMLRSAITFADEGRRGTEQVADTTCSLPVHDGMTVVAVDEAGGTGGRLDFEMIDTTVLICSEPSRCKPTTPAKTHRGVSSEGGKQSGRRWVSESKWYWRRRAAGLNLGWEGTVQANQCAVAGRQAVLSLFHDGQQPPSDAACCREKTVRECVRTREYLDEPKQNGAFFQQSSP